MTLSWAAILRLGMVQVAIGAIVVLMSSTLNRVMVVELALPAVLPGALVALHYGVQISRPGWGFRSDTSNSRTPWIRLGMGLLAIGANAAAVGVWLLPASYAAGLIVSVMAYAAIGFGVGASGTSLLALLATGTRPERRAAAAMTTWMMMIAGIAVTAGVVGAMLEPYSPERLARIVLAVTAAAGAVTLLATSGVERRLTIRVVRPEPTRLVEGLREVWREPAARGFTGFVFLSMVAYFMQELVLEPYGGLVFGLTPGETTSLSGVQHGGVFLGMAAVGLVASGLRVGSMRGWVLAGCLTSAAALLFLAAVGQRPETRLLVAGVGFLGIANGVFAVAAIGAMMELAGRGRQRREGTRMGLWGAAQAVAAGFGGLLGAALADALRGVLGDGSGFGAVFVIEAGVFIAAAVIGLRVMEPGGRARRPQLVAGE